MGASEGSTENEEIVGEGGDVVVQSSEKKEKKIYSKKSSRKKKVKRREGGEYETEKSPVEFLAWKMPNAWLKISSEENLGGVIKIATASGLEMKISALIGGGGVDANVRRWLRQVNGEFLLEQDISDLIFSVEEKKSKANLAYKLVDASYLSLEETFMVAIFKVRGYNVFLKLMGKSTLINAERDNFLRFCSSIHLKI